jgi:Domain of unknown function (DUF4062)
MPNDTPRHHPRSVLQVMVSSTFTDLQEHRAALIGAIHAHRLHARVMENDSARLVDVIESSLQMVRESAAYIGVISLKYGQTPESRTRNRDALSITELEFNEAQGMGRPILLFIMGESHPVTKADVESDPEKEKKLNTFRERAKKVSPASEVNRVYAVFNSLQEFKDKLGPSLAELSKHLESTNADGWKDDSHKRRGSDPATEAADWGVSAARLLAAVLLQNQDDGDRRRLSEILVHRIAEISDLHGPALYQAVRVFIEFHLLRADEPTSPRALFASCAAMPNDKSTRVLIDNLKRGANTGDYRQVSIGVSSLFFMHARGREPLWQRYFEALRDQPGELALGEEQVGSLAQVDIRWGFLAPQFLIAGLLSRFNDDWRPVLGVYSKSLPKAGARDGGFANLQASQWNCWLVWGPSVPICRCEQWRGHVAFQYGYGDESNSLPLLDTRPESEDLALDARAAQIVRDGQGAGVARLTARLRWGPFLLRGADGEPDPDGGEPDDADDPDPDDPDPDLPPPRPVRKLRLADAQSVLLCPEGLVHAHHSDGLLLELIDLLPPATKTRESYFSAYFWVMFLVAGPLQGDAGPRLLWRRHWPEWPERPAERGEVRSAQLWRDLLPVFVHANVADAQALATQRRTLVESALATLRIVWSTRDSNFHADDVAAGICFHLTCASDYSGCGEPIRYEPPESLCALLRKRLADEPDRAFAQAVHLPAEDENAATRPWGLAGYFSSCHLNEMVADYFEYVARLNEEKKKEAAARRR